MPDPIDPLQGPKLALEGKVVTMNDRFDVLDHGVVYIEHGSIVDVRPTGEACPVGFDDTEIVATGDTMYPGLIELHNHLSYNVLPLWNVPKRFEHNGQWQGHPEKRSGVSAPMAVLAQTDGLVQAVVRYVECKCLLGGVTTSQGITLSSAAGIRKHYRGILRNVEQTDEDALPEAATRIADVSDAESFLGRLEGQSCLLLHLSEGIGETARKRFQVLQLEDGTWAITGALTGIHSAGLLAEDFEIFAAHGGSMVWSPLSNYLLYGETAQIRAAKEAGVLIGIGADWSPTGSKNLLGELKVARLVSRELGDLFTDRDILAMATRNAARILKWDQALGSIEPGKRADLLFINNRSGDPYERLIDARETSVTLVMINGVPRYGQQSLMERLGPVTENLTIGRSRRAMNLEQVTADPVVGELSLGEATRRLDEALRLLPVLARNVDEANESSGGGFFGGAVTSSGETLQLVLDNESGPLGVARLDGLFGGAAAPGLFLGATKLADLVEPMQLDPLTVADDPEFLPRLMIQMNLPRFIKEGLPDLYGRDIPLPQSASFLRSASEGVQEELALTMELRTLLSSVGEMDRDERVRIVEQALLLFEENYVHLPVKQAMYGIRPVQRLKLMLQRLESGTGEVSEIAFHRELMEIFTSVRDLHTAYEAPEPFRDLVAFLPFIIEEFHESDRSHFMVTKLVGDPGPDHFRPGVEVTYWNGTPIGQAVRRHSDTQGGGNLAARRARGIDTLTIRPLRRVPIPDEEWVTLRYRDLGGQEREWTQSWLVFMPKTAFRLDRDRDSATRGSIRAATTFGIDTQTNATFETKKRFFAPTAFAAERDDARQAPTDSGDDDFSSAFPTLIRAGRVTTPSGVFGYVRLFSFNMDEHDADGFITDMVRLVEKMPAEGLILDVRGNGGGLILAAERLLQLFGPRRIEPETAQFAYSRLNLALCRRFSGPNPPFDLHLDPWVESMEQAVQTASAFSNSFPITDPATCNTVGQRYYGPVVLITDGLCYSATDIFVAGFQDHGLGTILGVDPNTGAGGANVWTHRLLDQLMGEAGDASRTAYRTLPRGANMSVAIRRMLRVGKQSGTILEDFGIQPAVRHRMTREDVLHGNRDLIATAGGILAANADRVFGLTARLERAAIGAPTLKYDTRGLDRLDLYRADRPIGSVDVTNTSGSFALEHNVPDASHPLELRGYRAGELVARRLISVS